MKKLLLLSTMVLSACATTGGAGKSGGSFQGEAAVTKRRNEISDAAKPAMECLRVKAGEEAPKGGVFAVVADAAGKLTVTPIMWNGTDAQKQCIVDAGTKSTITPLSGPPVGGMWEFMAPGEKPEPQKAPPDFAVKMQPLQETMQAEVVGCGQRTLGVDFGATIEVSYFLYNDGKAYAPTVIMDDSKDGSFEQCVLDVVAHTNFPKVDVPKPFGATYHAKIGQYGDTKH